MNVSAVARIWQAAGVSVIPILDNQTKRPVIRWSPYQAVAPTLDEVNEWWGNGKPYGLALICGAVSGNLEMTEIEGRAMVSDKLQDLINRMDELGVGHIWDLLYGPEGFTEMSPSGGLHFLYRISDHPVPGNTKIAANEDGLCVAETRGHGGYVITAPTPGICHPSGEPWLLREGQYGILPTITWEERTRFHEALRLALDETVPTVPMTAISPAFESSVSTALSLSSVTAPVIGQISPGDDYESRTDWATILEPHGWTLESRHANGELHWTRPGKHRREGASATTGHAQDRDRFYPFSTSTQFAAETSYTKFAVYTILNHAGDYHAAARELARRGYGIKSIAPALDTLSIEGQQEDTFSCDDIGNAHRLKAQVGDTFHWVPEESRFYRWDGRVWAHDFDGALTRETMAMTDWLLASGNEHLIKHGRRSRSVGKVKSAQEMMRSLNGVTLQRQAFDPHRNLLNLRGRRPVKLTPRQEAAALHGVATNRAYSTEARLQVALQALDWYEKYLEQSTDLANVLEWIRFQALLHYVGGAFDPEHMRAIANLAADVLDGRPVNLPDYREAMEQARNSAHELYTQLVEGDHED